MPQPRNKSLESRNLHEYLKTLPQEVLDNLYNHPATCLAVFRELPALAKQLITRLIYIEQAIPQAVVSSWVTHHYQEQNKLAQDTLTSLRVWKETSMSGGLRSWLLNPTFRSNLKMALTGGGQPWTMSAYLEADPHSRDIVFLDSYASERWETVLHYMVASSQQAGISQDAVHTLLQAGLMSRDETQNNAPVITRSGFQFLLMERSSQVWYFILQYLNSVSARGMSLVECLSFLFQLSFSQLGKDYSTDGMSQGLLTFLQHLREFGLVYQRRRTSGRFYPTILSINILKIVDKTLFRIKDDFQVCSQWLRNSVYLRISLCSWKYNRIYVFRYIVVETNYRVYAYTDSSLQLALLGLFSEMMYRFPNLCVAVITRKSARQAFRGGITASQIIRFLNMHAHPKMMKSGQSQMPPTVSDQIRLWEQERDKFIFTEGVLYNQFLSQADYEMVRSYAEQSGCVVWSSEQRRTLVVTQDGHNSVRKFWKQNSKR
ncbi:general transcription factor IIH subunit 4 [Eurytemora carolleeae]|uniref:general transcription factor IIH subunit 4 n=1 Tax=Eurytemora carolleeae TaxID=1294199 RepID=UPI000C78441F|nr:general transcription factor IIH subunit 4 [Eurytemora carolleeae]|eukprot:XP_023344545.1 general transcription factor IIH subunit 4-like [Eurytemora affinis]